MIAGEMVSPDIKSGIPCRYFVSCSSICLRWSAAAPVTTSLTPLAFWTALRCAFSGSGAGAGSGLPQAVSEMARAIAKQ